MCVTVILFLVRSNQSEHYVWERVLVAQWEIKQEIVQDEMKKVK